MSDEITDTVQVEEVDMLTREELRTRMRELKDSIRCLDLTVQTLREERDAYRKCARGIEHCIELLSMVSTELKSDSLEFDDLDKLCQKIDKTLTYIKEMRYLDIEIECGQVWKLVKQPSVGYMKTGRYMITLSCDKGPDNSDTLFWRMTNHWSQDKPYKWGGSRDVQLTEREIREHMEYVGSLPEILRFINK